MWPVQGPITGPFGRRLDPFSDEGAFHKGVDISVPSGTAVHVTADGMVMQAEMVTGGYGRLVVVNQVAASRLTTRTSPASTCMPDRKCGGATWWAPRAARDASPRRTCTTKSASAARP